MLGGLILGLVVSAEVSNNFGCGDPVAQMKKAEADKLSGKAARNEAALEENERKFSPEQDAPVDEKVAEWRKADNYNPAWDD